MTPKEALEIIYSYQSWDCYNDEPNLLSDVELEALNVLKNALTELEELKRDVARFMELKNNITNREEMDEFWEIDNKLSKVGKEE
jgi:hypothetical protein